MRVELTRFRVKPRKTEKMTEWLSFLRAHLPQVLDTLEGEKMYVETIFHERRDGHDYLYWYSVQGTGGVDVSNSEHAVDRRHLEYWKECIDPEFQAEDLNAEVVMIQEKIRALMS